MDEILGHDLVGLMTFLLDLESFGKGSGKGGHEDMATSRKSSGKGDLNSKLLSAITSS